MSEGTIIVKKIKKVSGGHHGGAWKVAYADFVTAMMAFFLLLWLLNATTEEQKKGISNYFDPISVSIASTSGSGGALGGLSIDQEGSLSSNVASQKLESVQGIRMSADGQGGNSEHEGAPHPGEIDDSKFTPFDPNKLEIQAPKDPTNIDIDDAMAKKERAEFEKAKKDIQEAIESSPELKEFSKNLLVDFTPEGMRIQIVDQNDKPMFPIGSAKMPEHTQKIFGMVTKMALKLPNKLSITGHTDATQYKKKDYSNWELSAKRANASRRALIANGLTHDRIAEVSGRADRELFLPKEPNAPQNRRISIILLNQTPAGKPGKAKHLTQPEKPKQQEPAIEMSLMH